MEDLAWRFPAEPIERAAVRFCEAIAKWRGKPELEGEEKAQYPWAYLSEPQHWFIEFGLVWGYDDQSGEFGTLQPNKSCAAYLQGKRSKQQRKGRGSNGGTSFLLRKRRG
ncbi:hypothetical protein NMY22_g6198 [Coprinellus aureogranulatus]|nr:hypothetical protein NMY22_g6198 [Coprinellus aureogranulatus]